MLLFSVRGSIVVSIPACHAGNRGSIPRRGVTLFFLSYSVDSRRVNRCDDIRIFYYSSWFFSFIYFEHYYAQLHHIVLENLSHYS